MCIVANSINLRWSIKRTAVHIWGLREDEDGGVKVIPLVRSSAVGVPDGRWPSSFSDYDNGEAAIEFHMVKTQSFFHEGS